MDWLRKAESVARGISALLEGFRRQLPKAPAPARVEPAGTPEPVPEKANPKATESAPAPEPGKKNPSDEIRSFETLAPWERRAPAVFVPDPLPFRVEADIPDEPVPGAPWEPDLSGNVIIGRDDRFRAEEKELQEKLSGYRGQYGEFVPDTDDEISWADEDEGPEDESQKKDAKKPDGPQLDFEFVFRDKQGSSGK